MRSARAEVDRLDSQANSSLGKTTTG